MTDGSAKFGRYAVSGDRRSVDVVPRSSVLCKVPGVTGRASAATLIKFKSTAPAFVAQSCITVPPRHSGEQELTTNPATSSIRK
jgi:hypothetical protein